VTHTARCVNCGVLLYYPYPEQQTLEPRPEHSGNSGHWDEWYLCSASSNHDNFTDMIRFALSDFPPSAPLKVLDYGGGGGQFAAVMRSLYKHARVFITDIDDGILRDEWRELNTQISFKDFPSDQENFDVIFLNDVFEHVDDPGGVLTLLRKKLSSDGIIFIDTPRSFWLYPVTRLIAPKVYRHLLTGTVSLAHLQIWSRKAFDLVAKQSGLSIERYEERTEFTREPQFYLRSMGITNPVIHFAGRAFYALAPWIAKNKIMAVLR
jgi:2-polyprenyl-3-methyl-5-hydroxy-6-metoxy-1,4-benzoquinol methylase